MAGRCRRASNPLGRISLSGHKIPAFRLSVDRFNTGSLSTMYEVNNNLGFYYSEVAFGTTESQSFHTLFIMGVFNSCFINYIVSTEEFKVV